jgi:NADP-dependent 3-hydroxy acid dehydrogenase YdfG
VSGALAGATVLVTGASSGIGRAIAVAFAAQGARVALVARRAELLAEVAQDVRRAGGVALPLPADVTARAEVEHAVATAVEELGGLDVLVNNAGLMLLGGLEHGDPDEWDAMVRVNLQGLLYATRAALPHLLEAAGARGVADVFNVSSAASRQWLAVNGVYAMTKTGLVALTESLRQEVAGRGVRVHLVEPGQVSTELHAQNRPEVLESLPAPTHAYRPLEPEDVATAVLQAALMPPGVCVNDVWVGPTGQL